MNNFMENLMANDEYWANTVIESGDTDSNEDNSIETEIVLRSVQKPKKHKSLMAKKYLLKDKREFLRKRMFEGNEYNPTLLKKNVIKVENININVIEEINKSIWITPVVLSYNETIRGFRGNTYPVEHTDYGYFLPKDKTTFISLKNTDWYGIPLIIDLSKEKFFNIQRQEQRHKSFEKTFRQRGSESILDYNSQKLFAYGVEMRSKDWCGNLYMSLPYKRFDRSFFEEGIIRNKRLVDKYIREEIAYNEYHDTDKDYDRFMLELEEMAS